METSSDQTVPPADIPIVEAPATVVEPGIHPDAVSVSAHATAPPTTTAEQDRRTKSQRQINNVWEYTQSYVAVVVVTTTALGVFIGRILQGNGDASTPSVLPFPAEWWTIVGLVIGFYFGRTNHSRIGDTPRDNGGRSTDRFDDR